MRSKSGFSFIHLCILLLVTGLLYGCQSQDTSSISPPGVNAPTAPAPAGAPAAGGPSASAPLPGPGASPAGPNGLSGPGAPTGVMPGVTVASRPSKPLSRLGPDPILSDNDLLPLDKVVPPEKRKDLNIKNFDGVITTFIKFTFVNPITKEKLNVQLPSSLKSGKMTKAGWGNLFLVYSMNAEAKADKAAKEGTPDISGGENILSSITGAAAPTAGGRGGGGGGRAVGGAGAGGGGPVERER